MDRGPAWREKDYLDASTVAVVGPSSSGADSDEATWAIDRKAPGCVRIVERWDIAERRSW